MGDDFGSGLSSMSICFDFRSTNVVQLRNRNPYFYRLVLMSSPITFYHLINLPFDAEVAENFLNGL